MPRPPRTGSSRGCDTGGWPSCRPALFFSPRRGIPAAGPSPARQSRAARKRGARPSGCTHRRDHRLPCRFAVDRRRLWPPPGDGNGPSTPSHRDDATHDRLGSWDNGGSRSRVEGDRRIEGIEPGSYLLAASGDPTEARKIAGFDSVDPKVIDANAGRVRPEWTRGRSVGDWDWACESRQRVLLRSARPAPWRTPPRLPSRHADSGTSPFLRSPTTSAARTRPKAAVCCCDCPPNPLYPVSPSCCK
jgi:hypothetical protein